MTIWIVLGVVVLLVIAAVAYFATRNSSDNRPTGPKGRGRGRGDTHSVGATHESERDRSGEGGPATHRSHSETTRETPPVQSHDSGDQRPSGHAGRPSDQPGHEPREPRLHRGNGSEADDAERR